jgi:hypothetical protein
MNTDADREPAPVHETRGRGAIRASPAAADAALEFGRFRMLLRQRQLLHNEVPVELGTRAFDLLLVLLEADGLLLSKEELLSRVWPGVVVSEANLKVQISVLRKVFGAARCHPHRSRPWLPLHRRAPLHFRARRLSMFHASKAAFWPNAVSTELSAGAPAEFRGCRTPRLICRSRLAY